MSSASDTPRVYIGAYGFCRDPSGRLLLVRMASGLDQGRWTMPGGGIEWGEHPEAALLRDVVINYIKEGSPIDALLRPTTTEE